MNIDSKKIKPIYTAYTTLHKIDKFNFPNKHSRTKEYKLSKTENPNTCAQFESSTRKALPVLRAALNPAVMKETATNNKIAHKNNMKQYNNAARNIIDIIYKDHTPSVFTPVKRLGAH